MSDQPAFDFTRSHYRRNDPNTSRIAAEMAKPVATKHGGMIVDYLDGIHPRSATIEEIAAAIDGLDSVKVARRMSDLEKPKDGSRARVVRDGSKIMSTKRPGTLWKAAPWD